MLECLKALEVQVQKGNIRYFGLSNESAWGTAQWLRLSETNFTTCADNSERVLFAA